MSTIMRLSFLLLTVSSLSLAGCGSDEAGSVVDSGDNDAIQEYEAMIKAEEEQADQAMEQAQ